ncbi:MAG: triple tyrosine motif-containing protein [Bacteroidota bacterium]
MHLCSPLFLAWFYLLFFLLTDVIATPDHGKYPIQNFTPTDYKAGIQNIDFAQNRDRVLFVANNLGVLAFDGNEWNVHAFHKGKKDRSLAFDPRMNRLYVGSQGTFGYLDHDWSYHSLLELIPEEERDFDEVWDVFVVESNVYFCTFKQIYRYNGQQISTINLNHNLERSFYAGGKIFSQGPSGRLLEVKDNKLKSSFPQHHKDEIIAGIIQEGDGYLLFYNSGQIEYTTPFGVSSIYPDLMKALKGTYVNHVVQLSDTRLAISTQTAGLFLFDRQREVIEHITTQSGLLSNACLRAFQDYTGFLWVGMQNGMARVDINSPTRFVNQEIDLQGSGYDVFQEKEGTYYSSSNGIYYLPNDSDKSQFLAGTEGPAYGMQKIAGKLYACHHTGLFQLSNGQASRIATTNGLWQIQQLRSTPSYVIGGTYGGLYLFRIKDDLSLEPVQLLEGFIESSRFFEEDQQGRIWVGQFYKGLYRLQLDLANRIVEAKQITEGFERNVGEQIILTKIDNELYFATLSGLYRLDTRNDQIVKATLFAPEIGKQQIFMLKQDKQKNVHFIAENSVGFFKQISPKNYVYRPSSLFQFRYHFNNDLLNMSIHTEDGVMFTANEGFLHYRPDMEDRGTIESPMVISTVYSITEDSLLYQLGPFAPPLKNLPPIQVSHRARVLQIKVESFQFNEVGNNQFRYFLEGFDGDYGEWTNSSTKEYTNLTEGNYTLWVQTRNKLNELVTGEPLYLTITPPFYRSTAARIIYAILFGSILVIAFRGQRRRFRIQQEQVEAASQRQLAAKQERLQEIEQQKQQTVQKLEEDKMKKELEHLNSLLAASTMNLVVKNEFIENIKEELKEVRQMGKNAETRVALEKIVREIDTTLHVQKDWEQFEHHFAQVHGDFLNRLRVEFDDLTPNEQKLCAFLRLNLNTKDIANLMGISLRGVEVARYRLRKKLDLQKGQNLSKFILEY